MQTPVFWAVGGAKAVAKVAKLLRLGDGTNLPGKVARRLCPSVLTQMAHGIYDHSVAITGTNGKTTTAGLLAQFYLADNRRVVHNTLGANMLTGITAALALKTNWRGKLEADIGVLEVDEASLRHVAKEVPFQRVIVTNLFRDQLDRYGELDTTARFIQQGVGQSATILNADDPLVAHLGQDTSLYFGVHRVLTPPMRTDTLVDFPREVTGCPRCDQPLHYDLLHYGHLGHYQCAACGFQRPTPVVVAERVRLSPQGSEVSLRYGDRGCVTLFLPLPGLFNVYNLLAAACAAYAAALPLECLSRGIRAYGGVFGRAERKTIDGKPVWVMLIKNPVGASEVLKLVGSDPNGRLLIALNDLDADGRDVSWIWDAEFERLPTDKPVVVSGLRAEDLAVRLKYAGVDQHCLTVEPDLKRAIQQALTQTGPNETLYVLPTYTALLSLRNLL